MAVSVRENIDYRLLEDDYRAVFKNTYKPKKDVKGRLYYRCVYCGKRVYPDKGEMQVDHIIPKTRLKAGILWNPNKAWNLAPSCGPCNASKSNYLDGRVLTGFRNKMLSNFGLIIADRNSNRSESKTMTALISCLIAVVSFLISVLLPVVGIVLAGAMLAVKSVTYVSKTTLRFTFKKLRKVGRRFLKRFLKQPLKATSIICGLVYVGFVAPEFYTGVLDKLLLMFR